MTRYTTELVLPEVYMEAGRGLEPREGLVTLPAASPAGALTCLYLPIARGYLAV